MTLNKRRVLYLLRLLSFLICHLDGMCRLSYVTQWVGKETNRRAIMYIVTLSTLKRSRILVQRTLNPFRWKQRQHYPHCVGAKYRSFIYSVENILLFRFWTQWMHELYVFDMTISMEVIVPWIEILYSDKNKKKISGYPPKV